MTCLADRSHRLRETNRIWRGSLQGRRCSRRDWNRRWRRYRGRWRPSGGYRRRLNCSCRRRRRQSWGNKSCGRRGRIVLRRSRGLLSVHRLGLNASQNGLALRIRDSSVDWCHINSLFKFAAHLECFHLLPEILVGLLSILWAVEGDIPRVVYCRLASHYLGAIRTVK